jgi:hypothetical protein
MPTQDKIGLRYWEPGTFRRCPNLKTRGSDGNCHKYRLKRSTLNKTKGKHYYRNAQGRRIYISDRTYRRIWASK